MCPVSTNPPPSVGPAPASGTVATVISRSRNSHATSASTRSAVTMTPLLVTCRAACRERSGALVAMVWTTTSTSPKAARDSANSRWTSSSSARSARTATTLPFAARISTTVASTERWRSRYTTMIAQSQRARRRDVTPARKGAARDDGHRLPAQLHQRLFRAHRPAVRHLAGCAYRRRRVSATVRSLSVVVSEHEAHAGSLDSWALGLRMLAVRARGSRPQAPGADAGCRAHHRALGDEVLALWLRGELPVRRPHQRPEHGARRRAEAPGELVGDEDRE
jgi:hypothetical protein